MGYKSKYNLSQRIWAMRLHGLISFDNRESKIRNNPNIKNHEERKMMMNLCKKKIEWLKGSTGSNFKHRKLDKSNQ